MEVEYELTIDYLYAFQWRGAFNSPLSRRVTRKVYLGWFLALLLFSMAPAIGPDGFVISRMNFTFLVVAFPIVALAFSSRWSGNRENQDAPGDTIGYTKKWHSSTRSRPMTDCAKPAPPDKWISPPRRHEGLFGGSPSTDQSISEDDPLEKTDVFHERRQSHIEWFGQVADACRASAPAAPTRLGEWDRRALGRGRSGCVDA